MYEVIIFPTLISLYHRLRQQQLFSKHNITSEVTDRDAEELVFFIQSLPTMDTQIEAIYSKRTLLATIMMSVEKYAFLDGDY